MVATYLSESEESQTYANGQSLQGRNLSPQGRELFLLVKLLTLPLGKNNSAFGFSLERIQRNKCALHENLMTKTYVEFIYDICGNSSLKEHIGYKLNEDTLKPIKTKMEEALPDNWLFFPLNPKKNNAVTAVKMICICSGCKADILKANVQ